MGYYNVVQPCVVEKKHHVRPTVQPVEVDDTIAAPLVESGYLTPYKTGWRTVTGTYHGEPTEFLTDEASAAILDNLPADVAEQVLTVDAPPKDGEESDPGTYTLADPEADQPVRGPSRKRGRRRSED